MKWYALLNISLVYVSYIETNIFAENGYSNLIKNVKKSINGRLDMISFTLIQKSATRGFVADNSLCIGIYERPVGSSGVIPISNKDTN